METSQAGKIADERELRYTLEGASKEARGRIEVILKSGDTPTIQSPDQLRAWRAVHALELMQVGAAIQALAKDGRFIRTRRAATGALRRLDRSR